VAVKLIIMTTEMDTKLVIMGILSKLENMEKKYSILYALWGKSREELKDAHFKIGQLQGASLDGRPKVLHTIDPSHPQSGTLVNEDDTSSSSNSMSYPASDISHSDDDSFSNNQAEVLEEISKLKTQQVKFSDKLQDLTDSVSEKTLILSNIDLKIPANIRYSKVSVIPFIANCLRVRVKIPKYNVNNGVVKVIYWI